MKNTTFRYAFGMIFSLFVLLGCTDKRVANSDVMKEKEDSIAMREKLRKEVRLHCLMEVGNYDEAIALLDTLHVVYPNDPVYDVCDAWINRYVKEDEEKAQHFLTRSLTLYDSLYKEKGDFSTAINRAFVVLMLRGDESYQQELDNILSIHSQPMDSASVNDGYRMMKSVDVATMFGCTDAETSTSQRLFELVDRIYADLRANQSLSHRSEDDERVDLVARYTTDEFKQKMQLIDMWDEKNNPGEIGFLDYDIWTGTQEIWDECTSSQLMKKADDSYHVLVICKGIDGNITYTDTLTLVFKREGDAWLVDDFIYPDVEPSLRQQMDAYIRRNKIK